ncbi:MAG: Smr/MutS family protein, partial [Thermodesulfovibrionales bacterium]|nr:Smr/MutS family protein [Thermodesulfovibrionales bacterium]
VTLGSVTPVSDEELFLKAMEGVREKKDFRGMDAGPRRPMFRKHVPVEDPDDHEELMRRVLEQKTDLKISDMDEYDEWVPPGGRPDLVKRLHRGECSVQDYIDLHGLIEDEAEVALVEFLEGSRRRGLSCVKVIHGRGLRSPGEPVLKLMVARLLKGALSKHVRAYATAHPKDGGLGATYVLLKGR